MSDAGPLYDWLVRPLEGAGLLREGEPLIVGPEGSLRMIPWAALHDGERFLVQARPLGLVPALSLVEHGPVRRHEVRLLLGGVSEAVHGLPSLPHVESELRALADQYETPDLMLNESFRRSAVREQLDASPFNVVHIASHGEFRADPRRTYVAAYDGMISMDQLTSWSIEIMPS